MNFKTKITLAGRPDWLVAATISFATDVYCLQLTFCYLSLILCFC